jgi:hypothetical protein
MQPPADFQRNPPGRDRLAVFPRCSLLTYQSRYAPRSRLEKQPTDPASAVCVNLKVRDQDRAGSLVVRENQSRRDLAKVAQYEVLG